MVPPPRRSWPVWTAAERERTAWGIGRSSKAAKRTSTHGKMNLTAPPLVRRDEHRGWMMDVSDHRGPLRTRDSGEQRVTPLELFFDLVYVFAVTQLSHLLLDHLTVRGGLETLLLLSVVWSAWVGTTWVTNWFDPDRLPVRLMLAAVMLASFLMSVAIPEAFGERGLMFA